VCGYILSIYSPWSSQGFYLRAPLVVGVSAFLIIQTSLLINRLPIVSVLLKPLFEWLEALASSLACGWGRCIEVFPCLFIEVEE